MTLLIPCHPGKERHTEQKTEHSPYSLRVSSSKGDPAASLERDSNAGKTETRNGNCFSDCGAAHD